VTRPKIGIMIEVPAAIYQLEQLSRHTDFFSVGTNDLSQYLLAIDRNNPRVSGRLDPGHPALLHALQLIVHASRTAGKPVTVCGEMANDPGCALLLLGMGFDGLSISATAIPRVKWAVRSICHAHEDIGRAGTTTRPTGTCSPLAGADITGSRARPAQAIATMKRMP